MTVLAALSAPALIVGATAGVAGADRTPDLTCDTTQLTTDVKLRQDLTCEDGFRGGPGFGVPPPDIHVDLGGHTLTVINGTCRSQGPCGAIAEVGSVTNGSVVGDLETIGHIKNVALTGTAYLNEDLVHGYPAVMEQSTVVDGRVVIMGGEVTVQSNRLVRSSIDLNDSLVDLPSTQVIRNRISDSPGAGISVSPSCVGCPLDIDGVIADNTVTGSGAEGILVRALGRSPGALELRGNDVSGNAGDGIRVDATAAAPPSFGPFGPITITGNRADGNGGHGIDAGTRADAIVDGGKNKAKGNGLAPQCAGVVCKER